mmetsp:Transcript_25626/g.57481  ORF Transcript_25626/g.57481 Transcript_25626/m.57481 type:complete len:342 (+) Transcript_25626:85-1110(+)
MMLIRGLAVVFLCSFASSLPPPSPPLTPTAKSRRDPLKLSLPEQLIAGGAARAVAQFIVYPLDAFRTIVQTRAGAPTLRELGWSTLLKGCLASSLFELPTGAVQFTVLAGTRPAISDWFQCLTGSPQVSATGLTSATFAALCSCVVTIPREVLKQQLVTGIHPSFRTAVATIAKEKGIAGFFVGSLPTVARNVPMVATTFVAFGFMQQELLRKRSEANGPGAKEVAQLSVLDNVVIGMLAATAGCLVSHPVDVIKTRMMTQEAVKGAVVPYANVADCVRTILAEEGPKTFFCGVVPRCAYAGPLWAATFAGNAHITRVFLERREKKTLDMDADSATLAAAS